ncbi:Reverse transcriptase zinc-binding domain [Sesbania bispinosa]|nr:Reverse transcriptase zinc-binding domain [Sesbania bispinosa]
MSDPIWKAVWHWEGHQRAKCLLWLVLNNGLKTRSKGFRRGFLDTNTCALCASHEETPLHILRDCDKVREVWFRIANGRLPTEFFSADMRVWIFSNINKSSNRWWRLCFGISLWAIWNNRNEYIFQDIAFSVDKIAALVHAQVEIGCAEWMLSVNQAPKYKESLIRWSYPNTGWVKANVDGSVVQNSSIAGCGGVFRGSDGKWLTGFSYNLG